MPKGEVLIGWGSADITPRLPASLVGQFYERMATTARDPLRAVALAIEGPGLGQFVMVACDLLAVDEATQQRVREHLSAAPGGPDPAYVILCATHIHTGPFMAQVILSRFWGDEFDYRDTGCGETQPGQYADFLAEKISQAVQEAWQGRKLGSVSSALEYAVTAHNRRAVYADGTAQMYGDMGLAAFTGLEGPEDSGVELLYFRDGTGKLTGVAVNTNCPAQVLEHKDFITADIWGEVRALAARQFGPDVHILPLLGAAGDQSPRDIVRLSKAPPGWPSGILHGEAGTHIVAEEITAAIGRGMAKAEPVMIGGTVVLHRMERVALPIRLVTKTQTEAAQAERDRLLAGASLDKLDEASRFRLSYQLGVIQRYDLQQKQTTMEIEVHVIRIGNVVLATNPFELFLDYGQRIKARSPARQTVIVQLACGYGGYLPTARAVEGGGYSAMVSNGFFGADAGARLSDRTIALITGLFETNC